MTPRDALVALLVPPHLRSAGWAQWEATVTAEQAVDRLLARPDVVLAALADARGPNETATDQIARRLHTLVAAEWPDVTFETEWHGGRVQLTGHAAGRIVVEEWGDSLTEALWAAVAGWRTEGAA